MAVIIIPIINRLSFKVETYKLLFWKHKLSVQIEDVTLNQAY